MTTALERKRKGIHYTPPALAEFLAGQIWSIAAANHQPVIRVLDPACGDGQLLHAMLEAVDSRIQLELIGFETDADAAQAARIKLSSNTSTNIVCQDFIEYAIENPDPEFDIVISNPPYVRTQNLDRKLVKKIRDRFELTGRIDLYHAFCAALSRKLRLSGTLGLLTSNRFMYVQSGSEMRRILQDDFRLWRVFDLGDTKQFTASVLPAIVIASRDDATGDSECDFVRIYRDQHASGDDLKTNHNMFESLSRSDTAVNLNGTNYRIERGHLGDCRSGEVWTLNNRENQGFLKILKQKTDCVFGDVAEIKVGIKTTADSVFIRQDWEKMIAAKPEDQLLRPLLTHHACRRWKSLRPNRQVLYPYLDTKRRQTIDLDDFPNARDYLNLHFSRLSGRKYLVNSGRRWFEIWVPQQPVEWKNPKIVWPDIAEKPTFSLDDTGAIVNGDCYWIKLKPGMDPDWLFLMLAVANSGLATRFYDCRFHNKLYAGRRRFMTQYVKNFPLPNINCLVARDIVHRTKTLLESKKRTPDIEDEIEKLVQLALGPGD